MNKPILPSDAPIGITFFTGGGGVDTGLVLGGVRPACGVELDPKNPGLSRQMAIAHSFNFREYGSTLIESSIQDVAANGFPDIPRNPSFCHFSPVCSQFSSAKSNGEESFHDITSAIAIGKAIAQLQPKNISLEQVSSYCTSKSYRIIIKTLEEEGYQYRAEVVNFADYGIPQRRLRLILLASKSGLFSFPQKRPQAGWGKTIEGLQLTPTNLCDYQSAAIASYLANNPRPKMLLLERYNNKRRPIHVRAGDESCWTIIKSAFHDQRGGNRLIPFTAWIDGQAYELPMRAIARICGFPDWYILPDQTAIAGSILGYAVPPRFIEALIKDNYLALQLNS